MGLHHLSSASRLLLPLLLQLQLLSSTATAGEGHRGMELPLYGQLGPEWQNKTFQQRLDHFTYVPWSVNTTFPQRYFINTKYWRTWPPSKRPIIVYTAGEWNVAHANLGGNDFPLQVASRTGGLVVYIEHRYYGESYPYGSLKQAYKDAGTLGYLTIAQALQDVAEITMHVMRQHCGITTCPVISMGCSYGGMVAAWFRLKYPHLVVGAVSSSAPVLFPNGNTISRSSYYDAVSLVFRNVSQDCYDTIKQSWKEIDAAEMAGGLPDVQRSLNLCLQPKSTSDVKTYLEFLYIGMSQFDDPSNPKPERFCNGVALAPRNAPVLEKISAGLWEYHGRPSCVNISATSNSPPHLRFANIIPGDGWGWQTCTEIIFPLGSHGPITMFRHFYYLHTDRETHCLNTYNVKPRPEVIPTTFNISSHLRDFAGNIIFANGLRDPFSAEGVTTSISSTIVALTTQKGGHCTDMNPQPSDPPWLVSHRMTMINIIEGWILGYVPSGKMHK